MIHRGGEPTDLGSADPQTGTGADGRTVRPNEESQVGAKMIPREARPGISPPRAKGGRPRSQRERSRREFVSYIIKYICRIPQAGRCISGRRKRRRGPADFAPRLAAAWRTLEKTALSFKIISASSRKGFSMTRR